MGYCCSSQDNQFQTFRKELNSSHTSSPLNTQAIYSFETSESDNPMTQRCIPEEANPQYLVALYNEVKCFNNSNLLA
jgi:hypothetical protein